MPGTRPAFAFVIGVLYISRMTNFDLIGQLESYAAAHSMQFLSGAQFNQNYEASQKEYENGQLVLTAEFDASPSFSRGFKIGEIRYEGIIALGRKFEEIDTMSTLDETFIQKYNARLLDLMTMLAGVISEFSCDNELEVTTVRMGMQLNKFDTNIDFITAQITFVQ